MAITLVQQKGASGNSGASASVTLTSATTAGNLLVMAVDTWANPGNFTFTPPANWTQAGTTTNDNIFIAGTAAQFYYANNPGGISTISVSFTPTTPAPSAWHISVLEFSGVATTTPLDVQNIRQQSGTTTPSSGSVTTTVAGDLLVGWISEDDVNGAYTLTQPGGWTAQAEIKDTNAWASLFTAYQVQAAAGAAQYNPTLSSASTDSVMGIMAFKAAGGGPTTFTRTVPTTAALLATATRSIPSSAALLQTNTRTVNTSGALLRTNTRSVPASAAFSGALVRSVPTSAALLQAGVIRTIPTSAALVWTQQRSVQASGALLRTNTRAIVASGALLASLTRAIAVTASLSGVLVIQPNPTARSIALNSAITAKSVTTQQASGLPVATSVSLVASPVARSVTKL